MHESLTMCEIPRIFVPRDMSRLRVLAAFALAALAIVFMIAGGASSPALSSLAGGSIWCGIGAGVAGGLGIAGFLADGTIVGLPVGGVLGAAGLLVGTVTGAYCL